MNAAKKKKAPQRDFVLGLGATGLSIARYLQREDRDAIFFDSRDEPPGLDDLEELWPDAETIGGVNAAGDRFAKSVNGIDIGWQIDQHCRRGHKDLGVRRPGQSGDDVPRIDCCDITAGCHHYAAGFVPQPALRHLP